MSKLPDPKEPGFPLQAEAIRTEQPVRSEHAGLVQSAADPTQQAPPARTKHDAGDVVDVLVDAIQRSTARIGTSSSVPAVDSVTANSSSTANRPP